MQNLVQDLIRKSTAEQSDDEAAQQHLREALKLTFSRPNSDNMIAKLVPEIRRELLNFGSFESTIDSIVIEALSTVTSRKGTAQHQSTALFVLENVLSEIRPEVKTNAKLRKVVAKIRDAKISITKEVIKDQKLRGMFKTKNPSDLAREIIGKS